MLVVAQMQHCECSHIRLNVRCLRANPTPSCARQPYSASPCHPLCLAAARLLLDCRLLTAVRLPRGVNALHAVPTSLCDDAPAGATGAPAGAIVALAGATGAPECAEAA